MLDGEDRVRFQRPGWYRAVTLTERLMSLRENAETPAGAAVDRDGAARRARRRLPRSLHPGEGLSAQRLAAAGMDKEVFLRLLGEPIEAVRSRFPTPPTWLRELDEAFSQHRPSVPLSLAGGGQGGAGDGLLAVIAPLINRGRERLYRGMLALLETNSVTFDPASLEDALYSLLTPHLLYELARTMALELNVARLRDLLEGETPEDRFGSFVRRLRRPSLALDLLEEYPVLTRQLAMHIDQWADTCLEFLGYLCTDWPAIRATFSPEADPGPLTQVFTGAGDRHRGGRSVHVARFGTGLCVVYKPRSLAVDAHFQELLTWMNAHGQRPPFRTLKVLDRGDHGWMEFVSHGACTSTKEIRRFYRRQGSYLALLYAMGATDFHSENLIAAGEHPLLLDLEALLHPCLMQVGDPAEGAPAGDQIVDTVLRVGLLPGRIAAGTASEGIEISGLGAPLAAQLTPGAVPALEGEGTDQMHFALKRLPISGQRNRPSLNGADVDVLAYAEEIVAGFVSAYGILRDRSNGLLAPRGPLMRFADDAVRVIMRPTQTYAVLLRESFHPDVLRDALDRDCLFDHLWAGIEQLPNLARVIPAERRALLQGDVPLFTTRANSRDLWAAGDEHILDFFLEPAMNQARRRVKGLGDEDLERQLWLIRASLATLSRTIDRGPTRSRRSTKARGVAGSERLVAGARRIGDRLEALCLRQREDVSWLGMSVVNSRQWSLLPLGPDLYDGLGGVALFLAQLGAVAGEDRYTALAQATCATARRQLRRERAWLRCIGGFAGWGGAIYVLTRLGTLWDEPELLREAEEYVGLLPALIEEDSSFDVIAGAAGCLGGLLSLYHSAPSARTLAAAVACGDRLIAGSQPTQPGLGWLIPGMGGSPLTGFSHGAAGISWALLRLWALTGEERFATAARQAIAYERSLFSPDSQNWPDLRAREAGAGSGDERAPASMTAWCHGAPGIGLARLRTLDCLDDEEARAEIEAAARTTAAQGFGSNHSLCHGDLGNLELLSAAGRALANPRWCRQVEHLAATTLTRIEQNGWLCGNPLGVESPGLMTGLAGIGYGLLRLASPERVPSVLTLDAPPSIASS